jgi:steroid delta-isomerase-like uncharacterized protein
VATTETHRQVIERAVEVFNSHDPDAVAALYAGDAVVYDPFYTEPLRGREAIRRDYVETTRSFPDMHVTVKNVLVGDNTIAYEMQGSGTHSGPLTMPDGSTIPATNRRLEMRIAVFSEVDSSGIVLNQRRYYDAANWLGQLGLTA